MNLSRYLHTLRHLRPIQVYGRLRRQVYQPRLDLAPAPPLRAPGGSWIEAAPRDAKLLGPRTFRFLNETRTPDWPGGWNDASIHTLWMFNLHYFEDLVADEFEQRRAWHEALIADWIRDNGARAQGPAWEPYVTSVRITNWIKFAQRGGELNAAATASLAQQARYVAQRIEVHLLGNHVLVNAKALLFAGMYFAGDEAAGWLAQGLQILTRQLPEQILADGGHYELSPMYHSLVLEDVLDLLNLVQVYRPELPPQVTTALDELLRPAAALMLAWLAAMTFPDGQIALFNDAAWGIAPPPAALFAYAARLGIEQPAESTAAVTHLAASGYVRVNAGPVATILDVGEIGPAYQPGHGHADVLSFELALDGQRMIVNSGTSVYQGNLAERHRQRQTAAHSTVTVDAEDSSEVWGEFRVARRAHPCDLMIEQLADGRVHVACSHDGYRRLPGKVLHQRQWVIAADGISISDELSGEFSQAAACFYLHPDVTLGELKGDGLTCQVGARPVHYRCQGGEFRVRPATFHPQFGLSVPNRAIEAVVGALSAHEFKW